MKPAVLLAAVLSLGLATSAVAQQEPSANMKIVAEKVRADKKLLVAANITDMISIDTDRVDLMVAYGPKFAATVTAAKVARYYQIENKIRAVVNYQLADEIPLVP